MSGEYFNNFKLARFEQTFINALAQRKDWLPRLEDIKTRWDFEEAVYQHALWYSPETLCGKREFLELSESTVRRMWRDFANARATASAAEAWAWSQAAKLTENNEKGE